MYIPNAIPSTSRGLLLIRDNQIIGKAAVRAIAGHNVSVQVLEGPILDQVKDLEPFKTLGTRHAYLHFDQTLGLNLDTEEWVGKEGVELLKDVRAVDEFELRYGICPESFESVPQFREALKDLDKEPAATA